ncbi:hypothetical protein [Algibacter lectus]|uniref:Uncharacterized protein n=1 Tax=Algibacter lectus TaxID=221126 RepID=A0A4R8MCN5_9FLAO|nr:hypothetical protein [Algibacter lectus]MWW24036.1 hypothetical protein [Algibacter lectus]TDY62052.1 hypothetical protein DFQ06_1866 [Algibacter lectus]
MRNKELLQHDQEYEQRFIKNIQLVPEILEAAKNELSKQKVKHNLKLSDLQNGLFVKHFTNYHETQKNKFIPDADYNEYLKLCGIDANKLADMETRYKKLLDIKYPFYTHNHDYWQGIEGRAGRLNPSLVEKLKEAPTKKVYNLDDFLKISKDSYKVSVNPELFKLYLTNEKQYEAMDVATDQVKLCKRKKDSPAATIKIAGELVKDIDRDYKITWDNEQILNIK